MNRNTEISDSFIQFVRKWYKSEEFIPLHAPLFLGNEKKYLEACIDSTFVSSVGKFVTEAEDKMAEIAGTKYAVATMNGTSALHLAMRVAGVSAGDEVITQPLTFVATCNAIRYLNAHPVFIDISSETLGLCSDKLEDFILNNCEFRSGVCYNRNSGRRISACVPMHTFGHPVDLDQIVEICNQYNIALIEDSAEAIGSYYKDKHVGGFGKLGVFSFNGNKIITCGGGGMIVTNEKELANRARHLSTVAKIPHQWDFYHDEVGYNYRMPNLNAALLLAQMEQIESYLNDKRHTADAYYKFFRDLDGIDFFRPKSKNCVNNWLNIVMFADKQARDEFLQATNDAGVMTRPAWILMPDLPAFNNCEVHSIKNSRYIADRLVNIPSSVRRDNG